ncbi:Glyoxylase, beta-lactamase superfamily II [Ferrimonas sediminum]|uniref:Glyoxylase, beta-lactamase superfamily II n=1 Tax=Ferrimonas sediminum TaxID=718193 RepID=A0A1G8RCW1_9GAMM|nr:MBL fold metallo-hydrolase [Ferrimonas sediminum]SDJ14806.1 Glyoxylase, beta-lactamase superfamily II [Ferrimonas sediminum]
MKYQVVPVTPYRTNCTLLWCRKTLQAAIIDPGGDQSDIINAVEANGLTVTQVWLTHGHIDHAGAAKVLAERLGVAVIGPHRDDQFLLDDLEQEARTYGFPVHSNFVPDRYLNDGDQLSVGELRFEVLHTPGHTPGHVVFHQPDAGLVFVGDLIFASSVGRTDFEGGNQAQLLASITGKLWPLGNETEFVPGHGANSTIGRERQLNPYVADSVLG